MRKPDLKKCQNFFSFFADFTTLTIFFPFAFAIRFDVFLWRTESNNFRECTNKIRQRKVFLVTMTEETNFFFLEFWENGTFFWT